MNKSNPIITVVTPVFNNKETIEESLLSVINQTYRNVEYIIVDGGSKDGTLDIITKYKHKISKIISEPDKGIYDAMNKGVAISKGEWIFFLGADDKLITDNMLDMIFGEKYNSDDGVELIYGGVSISKRGLFDPVFDKLMFFKNYVHHQGAFYKNKIFNSFRFNPNYKVSSDYELNLSLYMNKIKTRKLSYVIATCGDKGVSSSVKFAGYLEEIKIRNKYLKTYFKYLLDMLTIARFFIKKVINVIS